MKYLLLASSLLFAACEKVDPVKFEACQKVCYPNRVIGYSKKFIGEVDRCACDLTIIYKDGQ